MSGKNPTMKFFIPLFHGFESKLWLPPDFVAKAKGEFSAEAVVTTQLGTWKMEVGESKGRFCFHGGYWDSFLKAHDLHEGDIVVFQHHGKMQFNALIFDPSSCEKEFPDKNSKPVEYLIDISSQLSDQNPSSERTINGPCDSGDHSSSCLSPVYIPVGIWEPNKLDKKKTAFLRIPAPAGEREWPVKLKFYEDDSSSAANGGVAITKGWSEFCLSNNIKKGDVCSFEIGDAAFGGSDDVAVINVTVTPK